MQNTAIRVAQATVAFNGGTSFSYNVDGIATVTRQAVGVYRFTLQNLRHKAESTVICTAQGAGDVKVNISWAADGYSYFDVSLWDSTPVPVAVDAGFSLSVETLPPTGGQYLSGPFQQAV